MTTIVLSEEARRFWDALDHDTRASFRSSVLMDAQLLATLEQEAVELYAEEGEPMLIHPALELEPCPGCSQPQCQCASQLLPHPPDNIS
jgi:hypothetical protein